MPIDDARAIAGRAITGDEYSGDTARFLAARPGPMDTGKGMIVTDWNPTDTTGVPKASTVRTLPFDEDAVAEIAETLSGAMKLADFRLPSSQVWQVTLPRQGDSPVAMLTLWPGIKRVDAINGLATVVLSGVQTVDIVPGVEVQLRRSNRDCLIIARSGKIIVRA